MSKYIWSNGHTKDEFRLGRFELVNLSEEITEIREYATNGTSRILDYKYAEENESALDQAKRDVEGMLDREDFERLKGEFLRWENQLQAQWGELLYSRRYGTVELWLQQRPEAADVDPFQFWESLSQ